MNKIFTQIALGMVCLFANTANAQLKQTFEYNLPDCWITSSASMTKEQPNDNNPYANKVLTFTNNGTSILGTPFIKVTSRDLTISFKYKLSTNLQSNKVKSIVVGYQDEIGDYIPLIDPIVVTNQTAFIRFEQSFFLSEGIPYQIIIKAIGDGLDDNVMIDDLLITGCSYYYEENICNSAPIATPHTYYIRNHRPYSGNFLKDGTRDTDPDGENITVTNITPIDPAVGRLIFRTDSSFTFEPSNSFTGGPVEFYYTITDHGFNALSSTAKVTIDYPIFSEAAPIVVLPVHFLSFSGHVNTGKAQLAWNVAENETGRHFEIEKSTDGKSFKTLAIVLNLSTSGTEKYLYTDAAFNTAAFYRIKSINNNNSATYSHTIYLKGNSSISSNALVLMQNPVNSNLNFSYQATANTNSDVTIYNAAGTIIHKQKLTFSKGSNIVTIPLGNQYLTGNYILEVRSQDSRSTAKFVKF